MEKIIMICGKPFCKAHFEVERNDSDEFKYPEFCPKCVLDEATVTWEDKKYEGSRWDNTPHQIKYRVTNFK